ncbi:MAG TPA: hypothetical protein VLS27_12715 [Gammaproteobacteria bacterium]|nr:hypothetical protein [Gammaproteobacteria bacterium]
MRVLILLLIALSPVTYAGDAENVREFFADLVGRATAFDAGIADLYSPDARIITLRDGKETLELSGAQWKRLLVRVMPIAKKRGDTSTFENVKVSPHGDGYRVTAIRTSAIKCVSDPNYHLDVVQLENRWVVVEEYTETVSLSQCKPSNKLAASLKAIRGRLLPLLPLDLDADTRLESVEIIGPALIYHQRLHTVAAAEMDLARLVPMLRQIGVRNACGTAEMKKLLEEGATLRYAYVDRDGAKLADVDVAPGLCT